MAGPLRVLLTGASGYIGSRLAAQLADNPEVTVRALVRKPVSYVAADETVCADLPSDEAGAADACVGIDTVVHLAGHNEVTAISEPERVLAETLAASLHIARAAAGAGVRRLVYLSTVHVYGAGMTPGATLDEQVPPEPRSAYAIARLASEHLLAAEASGLEVVLFRLTNSVGAPAHPDVQRWTLVTNDLSRQAALSGTMRLLSSGAQWRDFVALGDVCDILSAVLAPGSLPPGTYNLASGVPRTVRELAGIVQDAFVRAGAPRPHLDAPPLPDDPPGPYRVATAKLAQHGFVAQRPLEGAVDEVVRFCLTHRDQL
jgi:UDP-glucose 4-epimerase